MLHQGDKIAATADLGFAFRGFKVLGRADQPLGADRILREKCKTRREIAILRWQAVPVGPCGGVRQSRNRSDPRQSRIMPLETAPAVLKLPTSRVAN